MSTEEMPAELAAPVVAPKPGLSPAIAAAVAAATAPAGGTAPDFRGAFAPAHIEKIDGVDYTFPVIEMDDWATTANNLTEQRRKRGQLRLMQNPQISPQDREWILTRLDQEPILFMDVFNYRTNTPEGIRNGLIRQLMKGSGLPAEEATAVIRRLPPLRQRTLIRIIADPPIPDPPKPGSGKDPNAPSASTKETGGSMPPSSEDSSLELNLGA